MTVNLRLCLLLLAAAALAPLRGQIQTGEPVHMRPEFPLVFPLVNVGTLVTLKYPVLINETTVLKPGMQLRIIYVLNTSSVDGTDLALAHAGTLEQSYARDPAAATGAVSTMPPQLMHQIEGYRRTVWQVPNNFVLAMAQYPTETMHLIYSPTAKDSNLKDEMFHFFDGLFVGTPGGKLTVIAVEKQSVAEQAGIRAGDTIVAVGPNATHDDLLTFANDYAAAKREANENETSSYPMTLRGADGTMRTANLAMPMRLKGGLMDGFSDTPPPQSNTPAPQSDTPPAPKP